MKTVFKLHFARKGLNNQGQGLLQIEAYFSKGSRKFISTKTFIDPDHWDKNKKCIRTTNIDLVKKDKYIRNFLSKIEDYEYGLLNEGKHLTPDLLDQFLNYKKDTGFFNSFYYSYLTTDRSITKKTYADQRRTLELINEFNPKIKFEDLNYVLIRDFNNFLLDKNYNLSTIAKHHKNFKKYINLAIKYELFDINKYPYRMFKVKQQKPKHRFLTSKELRAVEDYDFSDIPKIETVKDIFLFSCYTGLRYSDVSTLTKDKIMQQLAGIAIRLERMYKVDRRVFLKLYELFDGKPETIIKKYLKKNKKNDLVFDYISNVEINRCLKVIQQTAGISQNLTFHIGRHTFGTHIARTSGSIFEVMKLMGLSKFETAQIYIDLSDEI